MRDRDTEIAGTSKPTCRGLAQSALAELDTAIQVAVAIAGEEPEDVMEEKPPGIASSLASLYQELSVICRRARLLASTLRDIEQEVG